MSTSEYSYRERGGNRCEGTCGRQLSNSTQLRIIGFSRGATPIRSDSAMLSLGWATLPTNRATLIVSSLAGPYCYRMDRALSGGSQVFQWPSHIAREIRIAPSALTGLIRIARSTTSPTDSMLIPIERVGLRSENEPLIVQVVPGRDFDELFFTLTTSSGDRVLVAERSLGESYYPEGRAVRLLLPTSLPIREPVRWQQTQSRSG